MGRLIDCNDVYNAIQITTDNFGVAKRVVEDNMLTMLSKIETVEAIPKDQYEARLKADLEAVLTELQLEIEEARRFPDDSDFDKGYNRAIDVWKEVIQEKINNLQVNNSKVKEQDNEEL
jgi:hypothetical protein